MLKDYRKRRTNRERRERAGKVEQVVAGVWNRGYFGDRVALEVRLDQQNKRK